VPPLSRTSQAQPLPNCFTPGVVELLLEGVEVAKGALDGVGDGAAGLASGVGGHDLPEHGVVDVAAAVVADGAANVFGDGVEVAD
jgi:hypothetical protein